MYIFIGITLLILAGVIFYPKAKYNLKVKEQNNFWIKQNEELNKTQESLTQNILNKQQELKLLEWKTQNIEESEQKIYTATKEKYKMKLENEYKDFNSELAKQYEKLAEAYTLAKSDAKEEYLRLLTELKDSFIQEQEEKTDILTELREQVKEEQKLVESAVAARKREEEEKEKKDFYRLKISNSDLEDIEKLNDVALLLNTPEVLYKTIWKVYYEKPYADLIGRVLGTTPITGIYKITNINNGKSYVGQSANVQERWRQHIKRGCGAEAPTRNKLYPAMLEEGVYNFYFELLEECPRDQLDKKEDYWQKYFNVIDYGYSIK